jgi:hypothetical protein
MRLGMVAAMVFLSTRAWGCTEKGKKVGPTSVSNQRTLWAGDGRREADALAGARWLVGWLARSFLRTAGFVVVFHWVLSCRVFRG